MAQFRVVAFHRVCFGFVEMRRMLPGGIHQRLIQRQRIAVVVLRRRSPVHDRLQHCLVAAETDRPAGNAARRAVYRGYDIGCVFFEPANVYSSSNSTVSTGAGTGAGGIAALAALIQLTTVW